MIFQLRLGKFMPSSVYSEGKRKVIFCREEWRIYDLVMFDGSCPGLVEKQLGLCRRSATSRSLFVLAINRIVGHFDLEI